MKKVYTIILIILALALVGMGVWYGLKNQPKKTVTELGHSNPTIKLSSQWTRKQVAEAIIEYQLLPNTKINPEKQKILKEIKEKKAAKAQELSKKNKSTDFLISITDSRGKTFDQELFKAMDQKKATLNLIDRAYAQDIEEPCSGVKVPSINDNFEFGCDVPDEVRGMLNNSYAQIENIYGPKLADRVSGTKDVKITIEMMDPSDVSMEKSDYYCADDNTMTLNPLHQKDDFVLKHELVHAFHHLISNSLDSVWEEGMTEAVTWLLSTDEQRNNNILQTYFSKNIATGWGQDFPGSRTSKGFYEAEPLSLVFRDSYDWYVWFSMANVKFYYLYGPSYFKIMNSILFLDLKNAAAGGVGDIYNQQMMQKVAGLVPVIEGYPAMQWFAIKHFALANNFTKYGDGFIKTALVNSIYAAPDNGYSILADGTGLVIYSNTSGINNKTYGPLKVFDANNRKLGEIEDLSVLYTSEEGLKIQEEDFIAPGERDYYHSYRGIIRITFGYEEQFEEFLPKTDSIYDAGGIKKIIYGLAIGQADGSVASINGIKAVVKNGMYTINNPITSRDGLFNVEISPTTWFMNNQIPKKGGKINYQFYKAKIDSYTTVADLRPLSCCVKVDVTSTSVKDSCLECGKTISFNGVPIMRTWGGADFSEAYTAYLDSLWSLGTKIDYSVIPSKTSGWNLDKYGNDIIEGVMKN